MTTKYNRQYVSYNYKMQWAFYTSNEGIKSCFALIKAVGAKSLTVINLVDVYCKRIDDYSGMHSYPYGLADVETVKYLRNAFRKNKLIHQIELLRR